MGLTESDLAVIDGVLAGCAPEAARALAADLRGRFPGLVVMNVDAADVLEDPWRSYPALDLHFVDTTSHCPTMTRDPATANGLLLASRGASA